MNLDITKVVESSGLSDSDLILQNQFNVFEDIDDSELKEEDLTETEYDNYTESEFELRDLIDSSKNFEQFFQGLQSFCVKCNVNPLQLINCIKLSEANFGILNIFTRRASNVEANKSSIMIEINKSLSKFHKLPDYSNKLQREITHSTLISRFRLLLESPGTESRIDPSGDYFKTLGLALLKRDLEEEIRQMEIQLLLDDVVGSRIDTKPTFSQIGRNTVSRAVITKDTLLSISHGSSGKVYEFLNSHPNVVLKVFDGTAEPHDICVINHHCVVRTHHVYMTGLRGMTTVMEKCIRSLDKAPQDSFGDFDFLRLSLFLLVNGISHFDVKPKNILQTTRGVWVFGDFDFGRERVSRTGIVTSTEGFRPPKFCDSFSWDLYSLGITLGLSRLGKLNHSFTPHDPIIDEIKKSLGTWSLLVSDDQVDRLAIYKSILLEYAEIVVKIVAIINSEKPTWNLPFEMERIGF